MDDANIKIKSEETAAGSSLVTEQTNLHQPERIICHLVIMSF